MDKSNHGKGRGRVRRPVVRMASWGLVTVLSACGTTVEAGASGPDVTSGSDLGIAPGSLASSDPYGVTGVPTSPERPSGPQPGVSTAGGLTPDGTTSTGHERTPTQSRLTPVKVGYFYFEQDQSMNALGLGALQVGSYKTYSRAVVDYMNAHGGIAGHPVILVPYQAGSRGEDLEEQTACATFTQDNHVIAVMASTQIWGPLSACLERKKIPLLNVENGFADDTFYAEHPHFIETGSLSLNAAFRTVARKLPDSYYTTPGAGAITPKMGVIAFDDPTYRRAVEHTLIPELGRRGLAPPPEDVRYVSLQGGTKGFTSDLQSAILRFKGDGVDHVVFGDAGGVVAIFIMIQANSAGFVPRYGLSSLDCPGCLTALDPPSQLQSSQVVGWEPDSDIGPESPGVQLPPGYARCITLMRKAGIDFSNDSDGAMQATAATVCDTFLFVKAAADRANAIDGDGLLRGASMLGRGYDTANCYASDFSSGRRYGAARWRAATYDAVNNRFVYSPGQGEVA